MLPEVDFWCSPPELHLPKGFLVNWTSPTPKGEKTPDSCLMYNTSYENMTEDTIITEGIGFKSCSRWDYSRRKSPESVVSQFDLVCGNDYLRSLSQSLYMAGKMIGAIGTGILSDKFGRYALFYLSNLSTFHFIRKRMVLVSAAMVLISGIAIAFSPSMILFIVLRACVAASTTGMFTCGFVYCMEHVGGKWSTLVSFGLKYFWAFGYLTVPLIAWAVPQWDHLQLAVSIPTLLFVAILAFPSLVPESPKWLLVKGRQKEAEAILINAEELNNSSQKEAPGKDLPATIVKSENEVDEKATIIDLFKYKALRKCTVIMYYLWFTNNLVYYGLTFNAGKLIPGDVYINMVIAALLEFLVYTIAIICFIYLGRR